MTPEIRRLVNGVAGLADAEIRDITGLVRQAQAIRDRERARKERRKAKARPRRETEAEIARFEEERHRTFVDAVMLRDGYQCQLCSRITNECLDPHHLEMGPNKIKHEKLSNTLTAHRSCHEDAHRNEAAFVPKVKAWAERHGYGLPNRKVYR